MIAPHNTATVTRPAFLAVVRSSGVLTEAHFTRAVADLPRAARTAADAAQALIAAGHLTPFQADRLLGAKPDGLVIGQYVVLDYLGKADGGRVYRARHRAMDRVVALKIVSADQTRDPARRAAVQAEARAAARLAHPNVVTVLDSDHVGDRVYLVLEFVEGATAAAAVRLGGPLPVARACEVARQTALGLGHAHDKGVTHGGLTPGCVLVAHHAGRTTAKLTNFGAAGVTDARTGEFAAVCDPADYRAPEGFGPDPAAPAGDVYALGGLLSFLLTGRTPFPGTCAADKARHHRASEPVPLDVLRPDVPPDVAALFCEMLAKDPAGRPTAADVAARLAPFAEPDDLSGRTDFNFAPGSGPGSTISGFLTGLHTAPGPGSDVLSGLVPVAGRREADPADTSPWAGLAAQTLDEAAGTAPVVTRPRAAPAATGGVGTLTVVLAAAGVAAVSVVAAVVAFAVLSGK